MAIKESKDYYTAAQTKKILGITDGMLYNYIDNGALTRIIPPGRKQGVYSRGEVERLARELQTFILQRNHLHAIIKRVENREEMRACLEISQELFGLERGDIEARLDSRMNVLKANPETYYLLKDDYQVIGYFSIMPLKKGKLEGVLGQTLPVKIDTEDIAKFDSGKQVELYLTAMGVSPKFKTDEKRVYGSKLISGLVELIIDLGKRGVIIERIAARSNMPDGIRLMKHIGFTEVRPLTPERRTFIIDVEPSGIPFVLQYKKALEESSMSTELEQQPEKVAKKRSRSRS
ncbi:hypothetical protein KDW_03440 [Dictyobacter vulcani]|uniref:Uncharacterized protein n=1 Tax=Dictyobacter vulcani TaxID=2607529 RepID=A0A5J4KH63_9CHLR|nr:hypothetical protein [Dictyobacter vulcani]GER86182.1 hypothetical protein KDW_03440 [Dictyobacter vulcani]